MLAERIRLLEAHISIMQELVFHSEASYERAAADREELLAQVWQAGFGGCDGVCEVCVCV